MKKALLQACALCVGATGVHAAGLDRSGQGINLIFEDGSVVQARLGYANPDISGEQNGVDSGNVGESFFSPGLGYKRALTDKLDFALLYDQPFGADVEYPSNYPLSLNPLAPFGGRTDVLRAEADVDAITAVLRYKVGNGFSALGGIRGQRIDANVAVPAVLGYEVDFDNTTDFGYLVGVAWERPEIAARVSLVYNSKITHDIGTTESFNALGPTGVVLQTVDSTTRVETPQSINLDFQTGVAPKTLVFGSVRWVDWPQADVSPQAFTALPPNSDPLVSFADETFTYTLGVGYQFSDEFSGAFSLGYERDTGSEVSNLGPTNGFWSVGVGGTYSIEKAQISGGIRYTDIGDATTTTGGEFSGNSAWSVGLQLTYALD
ncbi:outer membrane protein transport protein [Ruegeria sp. HU-ET01832]|uniref:OmpP1/FadL family transporter n=1 Tax=Ruegeria sp. HU-ET01832 TaxID=3135906 RepID=UPI00147B9552